MCEYFFCVLLGHSSDGHRCACFRSALYKNRITWLCGSCKCEWAVLASLFPDTHIWMTHAHPSWSGTQWRGDRLSVGKQNRRASMTACRWSEARVKQTSIYPLREQYFHLFSIIVGPCLQLPLDWWQLWWYYFKSMLEVSVYMPWAVQPM